jgi:hypothetical protein
MLSITVRTPARDRYGRIIETGEYVEINCHGEIIRVFLVKTEGRKQARLAFDANKDVKINRRPDHGE